VLKYPDDRRNKVTAPKRRTRAEVQKLVAEFDRTAVVVNGQHSNPEILLPEHAQSPCGHRFRKLFKIDHSCNPGLGILSSP
jgi:hypothetical protein